MKAEMLIHICMSSDVCVVVVCVPLACGGYGFVPFVLCMEVFSVYDVCLYRLYNFWLYTYIDCIISVFF